MKTTEVNVKIDLARLTEQGYVIIPNVSLQEVNLFTSVLGDVLLETEVSEKIISARLLASSKAMALHTDHYQADYIAWYCIQQSNQGGETLLVDTWKMMDFLFSENQLNALKGIRVLSHKVFPRDNLHYPMLSENRKGELKVFYSPWMVSDASTIEGKLALTQWKEIIEKIQPYKIFLKPQDVLIIDNGRMLHGRTAFPKNSGRSLKRFWIKGII